MKEVVKHSNDFSVYRYSLGHRSLRVLLATIAQIEKEDTPEKVYSISREDAIKLTGIDERDWRRVSEDITDELISMVVQKKWTSSTTGAIEFIKKTVFREISYSSGKLSFTFSPEIQRELFNLSEKFKMYHLSDVRSLNSAPVTRLFMWMKNLEKLRKTVRIPYEDLLDATGMSGSMRKQTSAFFRQVIDKAKADFAKHDLPLDFTYKKIKEGKRIVAVDFNVFAPTYIDE